MNREVRLAGASATPTLPNNDCQHSALCCGRVAQSTVSDAVVVAVLGNQTSHNKMADYFTSTGEVETS
jgi:hypothetical protein